MMINILERDWKINIKYLGEILVSIILSFITITSVFSQRDNPLTSASSKSQGIDSDALQNFTELVTNEIAKDQFVGAELLITKTDINYYINFGVEENGRFHFDAKTYNI